MKKNLRKIMSLVLALAMILSLLPAMTMKVEASSTPTRTLYVNDCYTLYTIGIGDIKTVSTSKKSVVTIKKDKDNAKQVILTAKKAGTATITIKGKSATLKYKITVKKLDVKVSMKDIGNGYILVSVTNNTDQIFDRANVEYSLVDTSGDEVEHNYVRVPAVMPGKTSYATIYYSQYSYTLDMSACKASVYNCEHEFSKKYSNKSSKVTVKVKDETLEGNSLELKVSTKNTTKDYVSGYYFILLYDCDNHVIGMNSRSLYLRGNTVETQKVSFYGSNLAAYDHYKVYTRAYVTSTIKD